MTTGSKFLPMLSPWRWRRLPLVCYPKTGPDGMRVSDPLEGGERRRLRERQATYP
jgi:hypothetical protein